MAIDWNETYTADSVASIKALYAGFRFNDDGMRVLLPVKYNVDSYATAEAVLDYIQEQAMSGMLCSNISAILARNNNQAAPADPGGEPRGHLYRFKALRNAQSIEDDLSLFVPAHLVDDVADVQTHGTAIAGLLSESGVVAVRYVPNSRR